MLVADTNAGGLRADHTYIGIGYKLGRAPVAAVLHELRYVHQRFPSLNSYPTSINDANLQWPLFMLATWPPSVRRRRRRALAGAMCQGLGPSPKRIGTSLVSSIFSHYLDIYRIRPCNTITEQ